ncbi:MAG: hypothetical protein KC441_12405, partial [Anaerolineales bacterium]|nr:hypothetical protein [Anaerolineales bacterium]
MANFYSPQTYGELNEGISQVLFSEEDIQNRVLELVQAISRDYEGCRPLLVGVLKGVFPFMS